ncbi:unnamed protein product [Microthlaspi erraticum]|uniref:DUF3444 domain-containing protein n=1 Tax=Microthlaspi erraticum TaxID=1685480 RepID=A0A6D2ILE8_9BRAS|nr:unnamed protein product [Microthlaspi erraticum]
MSSFAVGAVWALYDDIDDMPRLYAKIESIHKSPASRLEVTWLESGDEGSVSVACGRFEYGETQTLKGHLAFSHEMQPITQCTDFITLNPMKGETWALFRDWSNNPEQHKPPYKYDFVQVVLGFDDSVGVGVTYLGKVDGFVSVFEHALQRGIISRVIPPEEMRRFSHRVPSVKLTGEEKEGVPAGSFELDTAAIPVEVEEEVNSERQSSVAAVVVPPVRRSRRESIPTRRLLHHIASARAVKH